MLVRDLFSDVTFDVFMRRMFELKLAEPKYDVIYAYAHAWVDLTTLLLSPRWVRAKEVLAIAFTDGDPWPDVYVDKPDGSRFGAMVR